MLTSDPAVAAPTVRLVGRPHLVADCGVDKVDLEVPEGLTLGQMLDRSGLDVRLAPWCRVAIDGGEIPPQWWDRVKPKAGRLVTVSIVPTGSSNGDDNKVLRTVLTIAVFAIASVASGGLASAGYPVLGALAGAGIATAGSLDVNALLLPSAAR